jgi:hypothetical protein
MLPLVAGALVLASGSIGYAQDTPSGSAAGAAIQGLWLTTSFPSLTEHIGDNIRLDLDVQNKALPLRRVAMNVDGLPADGPTNSMAAASRSRQPSSDRIRRNRSP